MSRMTFSDGWIITEESFDADSNRKVEGLFTIGSGYLHLRGSVEEHFQGAPQNVDYNRMPANVTSEKFPEFKARWGTYVPGVYGRHPLLNSELINLPRFTGWAPVVNGERLDLTTSKVSKYSRSLNMKEARIERSLTWHVGGADVEVTFDIFVSYSRPGICVQRMTLRPSKPLSVKVENTLDADVRTNGYDHLKDILLSDAGHGGICCQCFTDGGEKIEMRSFVRGEHRANFVAQGRVATSVCEVNNQAQDTVVLEKYSVVRTSQDATVRDCSKELMDAATAGYDRLLSEHADAWSKLWEMSDVVVEGDEESQLAMRVSLYHLLRSHPRDERVAIDAKGYAGEGYFGRFFWDTEMYLVPFFLYTQPERAKELMRFRVNTLESARLNARQYGYPGARYAWESDKSGLESCHVWQYRDHEIHVTADIAYAFAHIAAATADTGYLSDGVARVVVEGARYWAARIDQVPSRSAPALLGVMGPDEYSPISHNNAYTNRIVKLALKLAAEVGNKGGASEAEVELFQKLARDLPILRRADGLVLQNEAFETLAEPAFDLWTDRGRTYAAHVSQERLYRSKNLKQADVLMMMFLFWDEYSEMEIRQAWDYYLPYTTHDSSLSAAIHSILACRMSMQKEAWDFWKKSSLIDVDFVHGGAAEGIHIAACGGNWMNVVFGFAGVKLANQSETLTINPALPEKISKVSFPLMWRGTRVSVEVTRSGVTVTHLGEGSAIEVVINGKSKILLAAEQYRVAA
ncbi:MAG: glycosyl hydrolase family 65 protein [Pseudomonadota bacterium]|jgi:trehalose/maltose hydrolase-like predicted phosphorylase